MDSDPYRVATSDLSRPSDLQKYMSMGDDVTSPLYNDELRNDKIANGRIFREAMKRSGNNHEFTFTCNIHIHALLSTRLRQEIPKATLRDEYRDSHRMAWCKNMGHNIIVEGVIKRDERPTQAPITSVAMDLNLQFFIAPADRPAYRKKIGTVPELVNWSTELSEYVLNVPQPFAYGREACKSLKKVILGNSEIVHVYKLRNRVSDLLRLQERQLDGSWRNCSKEEILKKVSFSGINADGYLKAPELWATYSLITPAEQNFLVEKTSPSYHDTFINELLPLRATGRNGSDSFTDIRGNYSGRAIFWVAENIDSVRANNYSNYTTNAEDSGHGSDPIVASSFTRGDIPEWKDLPSDHNNEGLDTERGIYTPDEPGYHAHIWGYNMRKAGIDLCVDFNVQSTLLLNLNNAISPDNFRIYTFLETIRIQRYVAEEMHLIDGHGAQLNPGRASERFQPPAQFGQFAPFAPL